MRKKEIALILLTALVELQKHDGIYEASALDNLSVLALDLAAEAGWDWKRDRTYVQWCLKEADPLEIAKENLKRFTAYCEL